MTRAVMILALLLLLCCPANDGPSSAGALLASHAAERPAAVSSLPSASEIPPSATTVSPTAAKPPAPKHPPPLRVSPRTLAISWQSYLGRQVQLRCRPVRRMDFIRALVVAEGARFIVMGPPAVTPCGAATSTFTVVDSTSVAISGRTVLPELLLEEDGGKDSSR